MMGRISIAIAISALLATISTPAAAKPADELIEIVKGEAVELRADRAYLLFRVSQQKGVRPLEPLLMRVPSNAEVARYESAKEAAFGKALPKLTKAYEKALERHRRSGPSTRPAPQPPSIDNFQFVWDEVANLQDVDFGDQFVKSAAEETFLVEALPGDYVLYGFTPTTGLPRLMVCLCLGTVGFSAGAGEVTDLGYLISDFSFKPSLAPELNGRAGFVGTVRPARQDSSMPAALANVPLVQARYRAIGRFFTPNAVNIDRLAPVPGVLDYSGGKVIDLAAGQEVPDNF